MVSFTCLPLISDEGIHIQYLLDRKLSESLGPVRDTQSCAYQKQNPEFTVRH